MPRPFAFDAASTAPATVDINVWHGEALVLTTSKLGSATVTWTVSETDGGSPVIQVTGGATITLTPAQLAVIPEGASYFHNAWRQTLGDPTLIARGRITQERSILPTGIVVDPPTDPAAVPLAPGDNSWTWATRTSAGGDQCTFTVLSLPISAQPIIDIEASLNGGPYVSLGITEPEARVLTVPPGQASTLRWRAISAIGDGAVSGIKSATPVQAAPPIFTAQPTMTANPTVGQAVSLTLGTASGATAVQPDLFELVRADGAVIDLLPQLTVVSTTQLSWNSTSSQAGTLRWRTSAVNSFGQTTFSNTITTTLTVVSATAPAMIAANDWSLTGLTTASGDDLRINIAALPTNNGAALTAFKRRVNGAVESPMGTPAVGAYSFKAPTPAAQTSVEIAFANSVGYGPWSAPAKLATPAILTGNSNDPLLSDIEALYFDSSAVGAQQSPLYKPGIDTPPAGITYSPSTKTLTFAGTITAPFTRWDLSDTKLYFRAGADVHSFTHNRITQPTGVSLSTGIISMDAGVRVRNFGWITIDGHPNVLTGTPATLLRAAPPSATATMGTTIDMMERVLFRNIPGDGYKSTGGGIIRFCYFDAPENLPYRPTNWDPTISYPLDALVMGGTGNKYVYRSKVANNLGNPTPTNVSTDKENAYWVAVNPHSDLLNPYVQMDPLLEIYGCFFNKDIRARKYGSGAYVNKTRTAGTGGGWGNGITQGIRAVPNTGSAMPFRKIEIHHVIVTGTFEGASLPIGLSQPSSANASVWEPKVLRDSWITPTNGGAYVYAEDYGSGNVITNITTYALPTSAPTPTNSAPVVNTQPTLTGSSVLGATLTVSSNGTASGTPAPTPTVTIERATSATGPWITAEADGSYTTAAGTDTGRYFRGRVTWANSNGSATGTSNVIGPMTAGYAQNRYDTGGVFSSSYVPMTSGTADRLEMSWWMAPTAVVSARRILRASSALEIYMGGSGELTIAATDSGGVTPILNTQYGANTVQAGVWKHYYLLLDWFQDTPNVVLRVNGAQLTPVNTATPPTKGTGLLRPTRGVELFRSGTTITAMQFADFYMRWFISSASQNSGFSGFAAFYGGSNPPDLSALPRPQLLLGTPLTGAQITAGQNLGTSPLTVTGGVLTDV